jgi:NADH:ubiquinone oxidoreductase subunit F (NADH-binding)
LIEGAMICAWAIQATAVYIYCRGEFWDLAHDLDQRIRKRKGGWIGETSGSPAGRADVHTPGRGRTSAARGALLNLEGN